MKRSVLVDSSFLVGWFSTRDPKHEQVRRIIRSVRANYIVPQVVLTEAAYLFHREGGSERVAQFLRLLDQSGLRLEPVDQHDLRRVVELLEKFSTNRIDFVDCCLVALAERLNIDQVATLDDRDFSILRKANGEFLEILR